MADLPQDWDPEAAFKRVADRRGMTVEELRAELAKRAKEYMPQKGLDYEQGIMKYINCPRARHCGCGGIHEENDPCFQSLKAQGHKVHEGKPSTGVNSVTQRGVEE